MFNNFRVKKSEQIFFKKALVFAIFFSLSFFPILSFNISNLAEAADNNGEVILWQENKVNVDRNKPLEVKLNAEDYTNLVWEFTYDSTALDAVSGTTPADFFEYGWKYLDENGQVGSTLVIVEGYASTTDPRESGIVSLPLPKEAGVSDLTFFIRVEANAGSDKVIISNLSLKGVLKTLAENSSEENGVVGEDVTENNDEENNEEAEEGEESGDSLGEETEILWQVSNATLNSEKPLKETINTKNYSDLKWSFTFDSTELEEKNSSSSSLLTDYFTFGWFYLDENSDKVGFSDDFFGKTGTGDGERGERVFDLSDDNSVEELNFFIEVTADATSSDKVKISNLLLTGKLITDTATEEDELNDEETENETDEENIDNEESVSGDEGNSGEDGNSSEEEINDENLDDETEDVVDNENSEDDDSDKNTENTEDEDLENSEEVVEDESENDDGEVNTDDSEANFEIIWQIDTDTLTLDQNKRLEKTVDVSDYENLTWEFSYDSRELDGQTSDYFIYGWTYIGENGEEQEFSEKVKGLANKTDDEIGDLSFSLSELANVKDLTLFVEIFGDSASSDEVKISNLVLKGVFVVDEEVENENTEDGGEIDEENNNGDEDESDVDEEVNDEEGETGSGEEDESGNISDEGEGVGDENQDNENTEENTSEDESNSEEEVESGEDNEGDSNVEDENNEEDDNLDEEIIDDNNDDNGNSDFEDGEISDDIEDEIVNTDPRVNRDVISYRLTRNVTSYRTTLEERVASRR